MQVSYKALCFSLMQKKHWHVTNDGGVETIFVQKQVDTPSCTMLMFHQAYAKSSQLGTSQFLLVSFTMHNACLLVCCARVDLFVSEQQLLDCSSFLMLLTTLLTLKHVFDCLTDNGKHCLLIVNFPPDQLNVLLVYSECRIFQYLNQSVSSLKPSLNLEVLMAFSIYKVELFLNCAICVLAFCY